MLELAILVLSTIANLGIMLLALVKNRQSATNRLFALLALCLATWPVTSYQSLHVDSGQLVYIRLTIGLVVLMNWAFYALTQTLPQPSFKWTMRRRLELIYTIVLSTGVAFTPYAFSSLVISPSGNINPIPAPGIVFFVADLLYFLIGSFITLFKRHHSSSGRERAQIRLVLVGAVVMYGGAVVTNFVFAVALHYSKLVILGPLYSVVFAGSIAVAIIKHRLFDIRLILARSIAYSLMLGMLATIYTLGSFQLGNAIFKGQNMSTGQELYNVALAMILAFTFQPLRAFFEKITDKIFYRYHYDSQVMLNNFSKVLVSELELQKMLKRSLTELCESLHIEFGQIVVFNNDRVYRIEHYGPLPKRLMIAPELARLNKPMLIADELESGERKELMEGHGVRVSMMLKTREEFVGYMLLGDKLSGDIYSTQDVKLLEIIGKELAVAILNAKAYAEIQEFTVTLQGRVDRATKRLRVANRHLKELDRAKDEFISMASHQLRTPLTTIKGYLSMMLEGDAGHLTGAQKEFVNYAFASSERMVNLISDLLNVSRLQAGRFLIQTKPTDMVRMISDEVRQLEEHAKAKNISLTFQLPEGGFPLVDLDENKTRQVIMNFIDNAIYYTQQGGVTVVLSQLPGRIRFEVRDTGIGVPAEARKKLFTKFYRADNAQTVRPDGTGLGLYLAKRVVEDQGGTIIFDSVEGQGSTFGFELPYQPTANGTSKKYVSATTK